jgi:hypothetical protein
MSWTRFIADYYHIYKLKKIMKTKKLRAKCLKDKTKLCLLTLFNKDLWIFTYLSVIYFAKKYWYNL